MTDKDFASKLAAGMRRAKQPVATEAAVPTAPNVVPAAPPATARRSGDSSPPRAAGPWANLHPARVWPD